MFSVSITHHSKIRELSDGNKNWKQKPNGLLSHGSHHFWVMSDGKRVMSYGNSKSKQSLSSPFCGRTKDGLWCTIARILEIPHKLDVYSVY